ncbi:MAG: hypothetical protein ETSY1_04190 [Candidatus Entotheonella factor]|uniref:Uncharacterized protein n=1 Tax=Entotheonella factor TaxID=1429438 RepID=W4LWK5_ENTF1|nr:MAG: hypothetical protein ETSY1_04190 [Candidatus Entotheonella factor]
MSIRRYLYLHLYDYDASVHSVESGVSEVNAPPFFFPFAIGFKYALLIRIYRKIGSIR